MMLEPRIQPLVRGRLAGMGSEGKAWLVALPGLIADLEREWGIAVGPSLRGGSASYVASARCADGSTAVIKIAVADEGWTQQVTTLERAAGAGYVRLLRSDPVRRAVLLEELGRSLEASGLSPHDQLRCVADTLAVAWQDAGGAVPPPGGDKASRLGAYISEAWERMGRPVSTQVIDEALAYAARRAAGATVEVVVVHGDPHPGNLLAVRKPRPGADSGYVFVDPDGFVADRAYDLGVALRGWSERLLGPDARRVAEGFCGTLSERTGVDATRIWEWGFLERVSSGLYLLDVVRSPAVGLPYLRSAEQLLG
jgi:streptomycin 6-kinase